MFWGASASPRRGAWDTPEGGGMHEQFLMQTRQAQGFAHASPQRHNNRAWPGPCVLRQDPSCGMTPAGPNTTLIALRQHSSPRGARGPQKKRGPPPFFLGASRSRPLGEQDLCHQHLPLGGAACARPLWPQGRAQALTRRPLGPLGATRF